jgi:hypothetical protein
MALMEMFNGDCPGGAGMDMKQTAKKLRVLTGEQAEKIIGTLEGWGYKDVSVGYGVVTHGKNELISDHPSDKVIHLTIEALFYGDDD